MVGELQQVRAQVGPARHELALDAGAHVAGQQSARARGVHPQHEGRLVAARGGVRRRPEGRHHEIAQARRRAARAARLDGDAARPGHGQQGLQGRILLRAEREPQGAHIERAQHRGGAPAVVQVGVGDGEDVQALDAQGRQGGRHGVAPAVDAGKRPAGVHQDRPAPALHEGRVSLADVQHRHAWWGRRQDGSRPPGQDAAHCDGRRRAQRRGPRAQARARQQQGGGQAGRAGCAAGRWSRQHAGQDLDGVEAAPGQGLGEGGPGRHERRVGGCGQGEGGRQGRRKQQEARPRDGDQVGQQRGRRPHAHPPGRQGRCGEGGGGAGSQQPPLVEEGARRPVRPRRRHQGRRRREGELGAHGEEGLGLEGQDDGRSEQQRVSAPGGAAP